MSLLDTYIDTLGTLPFDKAALGDAKAQHDLACSFFAAGRNGLMSFDEALTVALSLGRMAACHGTADACFAMSIFLAHHALRAPDSETSDIRTAESVAWLHRAAEAGHPDADKQIADLAENGQAAQILASAARIERRL